MWKWLMIIGIAMTTTLSAENKILAFSGSTRQDSLNKKLLNEAVETARKSNAKVLVVDLKDFPMPYYDGDTEQNEGMPQKAKELRQLMIQNQIIFIASPEYNSSLSAVLKNVIDWASRSEQKGSSREAFKDKIFVIMSASTGSTGGARGLVHLRAIIENVGGKVFTQQFTLPNANDAFDEQGHLKDPKLKADLNQFIQSAIQDK